MATEKEIIGKDNVWDVDEFTTDEKEWSKKSGQEKVIFLLTQVFKTVLMLILLYLFIVSLSLMANSFRILGGKASGRTFRDTELFENPIAGLVAGILVTVLVQSSSTSTSIIITMTAGELIKVDNAIPMIMGANIGTSVTNTIVSLGHMADKDEYRRAFAGATVHDMFNLLNVCVFLPIEWLTGLLRHIAAGIVDGFDITDEEDKEAKTDLLKTIVKPVNNRILAIDKKMITSIAKCGDTACVEKYEEISIIKHKQKDDNHLFMDTPMTDGVAGVLMVLVSLGFLCLCLILMVKVLQSIFRGRIAIFTRKMLNLEIQAVPGLANYILILFGGVLTILFQSSSVTTSTLTPLVGIGLIRIDKMFAFTVGANIGTCVTGVLSALVTDKRKTGLTVALAHVLFNVLGTVVWYPIPMVRNIPISMAKLNGNLAAEFKWWPTAYIVGVFLLTPFVLLAISAVSVWLLVALGLPTLMILVTAAIITVLRFNMPERLPARLRTDHRRLPRALCIVAAEAETEAPSTPTSSAVRSAVSDADIGKDDWRAAPVAWGSGWFIVMALLVGLTNAKWADLKYPAFDKRDHTGFSAWESCSYSYKNDDMVWAKPYDLTACSSAHLNACATKDTMSKCSTVSFSNTPDINKEYESSWMACRDVCPMFKWMQWCENQGCGGTMHKLQCQNVSDAVMRPYVVNYGPSASLGSSDKVHAWKKGDRCRSLGDVCDNSDSIKVAGDVGVVALVFAGLGQVGVMTYNQMHKKRDSKMILTFALACWCLTALFSFVSWLCYWTAAQEPATCIVEDVSANGAVLASGTFKDIASSSYTFGCVVGSWLLTSVTIASVSWRLATAPKFGTSQGRQMGDVSPTKEGAALLPDSTPPPSTDKIVEKEAPTTTSEVQVECI